MVNPAKNVAVKDYGRTRDSHPGFSSHPLKSVCPPPSVANAFSLPHSFCLKRLHDLLKTLLPCSHHSTAAPMSHWEHTLRMSISCVARGMWCLCGCPEMLLVGSCCTSCTDHMCSAPADNLFDALSLPVSYH